MKYSITYLLNYKSETPGKYDNWANLNKPELGFTPTVKIVNCNYSVYYK